MSAMDTEQAQKGIVPIGEHIELAITDEDLAYNDEEKEPVLHARTYIAVFAMFVQTLVCQLALQGPLLILSTLGTLLDNPQAQTWIPNVYSLVQAVLCPIFASGSDAFQARKGIIVVANLIAIVGAVVGASAQNIYVLIVGQGLMGISFSCAPLAYTIPSEVVPHKWRPASQGIINSAAGLGAILGPLIIGALTNADPNNGWRTYYVSANPDVMVAARLKHKLMVFYQKIIAGLYALIAIGVFVGYRPPKRHALLSYASVWQKIGHLDLPGMFILAFGLTLLLTGLNLGGGLYPWTNARVLATIVIGSVTLICFAFYEWHIKTGVLHKDLFLGGKEKGRTYSLCLVLMLVESILLFAYQIFYPILATTVLEVGPMQLAYRIVAFHGVAATVTALWGYASSRLRTIRGPIFAGVLIFTVGTIGFATLRIQHVDRDSIIFSAVSGIGFSCILVLLVAGVQLSTPHHVIATASAVVTSTRSIGAAMFTAIYTAVFSQKLSHNIPAKIVAATLPEGLPQSSLGAFIGALSSHNQTALQSIPGVTGEIIQSGNEALREAYLESIKPVFIIAIPFGAIGCVCCLFLGTMRDAMTYKVDAPLEKLHAKGPRL